MNEIDEVLKALGGAEAPAGLEDRVLRRLATVPARNPWFAGWQVAGVGGLAVAVVAIGFVLFPRHVVPVPEGPVEAWHVEAEQAAVPQLAVTVPRVAVMRTRVLSAAVSTRQEAAAPPSFPAPPMALTDQERALLAIGRSRDLPKFAAYNPENRDELIAQGRAEFNEFFPQPTPQEIYYETHRQDP